MARTKNITIPAAHLSALLETVTYLANVIRAETPEQAAELAPPKRIARGTGAVAPAAPGPQTIGDGTNTAALSAEIERLLGERPMTRQELLEATGARGNRIAGVVWRLQAEGKVVNKGNRRVAVWALAPARRRRGTTGAI